MITNRIVLLLQLRFYASLLQKMLAKPYNGIPNISNLYQNKVIISVAICNAKNSDSKVEDCTIFCLLDYHSKGDELPKTIIPVWGHLITLSPPWSRNNLIEYFFLVVLMHYSVKLQLHPHKFLSFCILGFGDLYYFEFPGEADQR